MRSSLPPVICDQPQSCLYDASYPILVTAWRGVKFLNTVKEPVFRGGCRKPMARTDDIVMKLKALQANTPDIEASAVVSVDGLIMASALPADVEEDRVSAMSAAMLSLGERIARELGRGELDQVYVKGATGFVFLTSVGADAVLTIMARKDAKLGLVFLDMKRTAQELSRIV